jgi:hypothetical protein
MWQEFSTVEPKSNQLAECRQQLLESGTMLDFGNTDKSLLESSSPDFDETVQNPASRGGT